MKEDNTPENPIRRFIISPQIYNLIKSSLMDPELENLPTDESRGLDFTITKTSKGGYADYSTSKWARRETALSATDRAAIDQYGLFNLGDFLPKKPGVTELKIIKEMFEASVNGEAYDTARWGQYYKPAGVVVSDSQVDANDTTESQPRSDPKPPLNLVRPRSADPAPDPDTNETDTTATVRVPVKNQDEPVKTSTQRAEDILAMIRNRQKS